MRHLVIASTTEGELNFYFKYLIQMIRKSKTRYEKNQNESIVIKGLTYHFVNLNYRNLGAFLKRHGKVEHVYQVENPITGSKELSERLLGPLVGFDDSYLSLVIGSPILGNRAILLKTLLEQLPNFDDLNLSLRYQVDGDGRVSALLLDNQRYWSGTYATKEAAANTFIENEETRIRILADEVNAQRRRLKEYKRQHGLA